MEIAVEKSVQRGAEGNLYQRERERTDGFGFSRGSNFNPNNRSCSTGSRDPWTLRLGVSRVKQDWLLARLLSSLLGGDPRQYLSPHC